MRILCVLGPLARNRPQAISRLLPQLTVNGVVPQERDKGTSNLPESPAQPPISSCSAALEGAPGSPSPHDFGPEIIARLRNLSEGWRSMSDHELEHQSRIKKPVHELKSSDNAEVL
jgi:hypothetical protein